MLKELWDRLAMVETEAEKNQDSVGMSQEETTAGKNKDSKIDLSNSQETQEDTKAQVAIKEINTKTIDSAHYFI